MPHSSSNSEKIKYWEQRLFQLLKLFKLRDILVLSWSLEAFRNGRISETRRFTKIPGLPQDHSIEGRYFIPPWSVDAVINEKLVFDVVYNRKSISTFSAGPSGSFDLRLWSNVSKIFNVYAGLANSESMLDIEEDKITSAIPRIFWPQYDWQVGYNSIQRIARAWHVYATPAGKTAFAHKYSVELEVFLRISFIIYVCSLKAPAVRLAIFDALDLSRKDVFLVVKALGGSFESQAALAREIRCAPLPRDFRRSVVRERPLFVSQGGGDRLIYVPSQESLLRRITDGLYYDVVHDSEARRSSGEYFEDLCFELLRHYSEHLYHVDRERATSYGKSADLFVHSADGDFGFIIECKIRRIPHRVLSSPDPWRDCSEDFDDVVKGIVQIWRTHQEFYDGGDPLMVGVVLQYDPWTMMGNAFLEKLFHEANVKADKLGISQSNRVPVALVGYADLENCLRRYDLDIIREGVILSVADEFRGFQLTGILQNLKCKLEDKNDFDYLSLAKKAVSWFGSL